MKNSLFCTGSSRDVFTHGLVLIQNDKCIGFFLECIRGDLFSVSLWRFLSRLVQVRLRFLWKSDERHCSRFGSLSCADWRWCSDVSLERAWLFLNWSGMVFVRFLVFGLVPDFHSGAKFLEVARTGKTVRRYVNVKTSVPYNDWGRPSFFTGLDLRLLQGVRGECTRTACCSSVSFQRLHAWSSRTC